MNRVKRILFMLTLVHLTMMGTMSGQEQITVAVNSIVERIPVDLPMGESIIHVTGLADGYTYIASASAPAVARFTSGENAVRLTSSDPYFSITASQPSSSYITIRCSDCKPATAARSGARASVIDVQGGRTAEDLIRNVFIGGECYDVDNIVFNGEAGMLGAFSNGDASIGMASGMIMSTGHVDSIGRPNRSQMTSTFYSDEAKQEPDLATLAGANDLFDVASIEFDFVPTDDTVTFRYVFASEEYCEYNFQNYNDKFGFFLSGPGINGPYTNNAENIALIPGQNIDVSINNVNSSMNEAFYVDNIAMNDPEAGGQHCGPDRAVDGVALNYIAYDGFTTVLTAKIVVQRCEQYHIKLVIADQSDSGYDSAVFFQEGSFNSGANVDVDVTYARDNDTLLYEGCKDGILQFKRTAGSDLSEPAQVDFTISPSSTAENGVDYTGLVSPVIIPAGDTAINIPIQIIADGLTEGIETIVLEIANACRCSANEVVIKLDDLTPISVALGDTSLCASQEVLLAPTVRHGLSPYSYRWNTGDTTATINVTPTTTTSYFVTVTDVCGAAIIDTATVRLEPIESAIQATTLGCEGTSATITMQIPNQQPSFVISWKDPNQATLTPASPLSFEVTQAGWYYVTIENPTLNCSRVDSIQVLSEGVLPDVQAGADTVIGCKSINLVATSSMTQGISWAWSTSDGNINSDAQQPTITIDQAGTYIVALTNTETNCVGRDTVVVTRLPDLTYSHEVVRPTCASPQGSVTFAPVAPTTTFTIDFGGQQAAPGDAISVAAGTHAFSLISTENCTTAVSIDVPAAQTLEVRFEPDLIANIQRGSAVELRPILNVDASTLTSIEYTPNSYLDDAQTLNPNSTPQSSIRYTVMVMDNNGCVDTASIRLELNKGVNYFTPNAFSPNGDNINDRFTIFSDETITSIERLNIFNRWGGKVFELSKSPTNDVQVGWNGQNDGKEAMEGTYVYHALLNTAYNTVVEVRGEFLLIR